MRLLRRQRPLHGQQHLFPAASVEADLIRCRVAPASGVFRRLHLKTKTNRAA
jgi:hypothetical protein